MTNIFFNSVLIDTINSISSTLAIKAKEYLRNDNPMHNFEQGAKTTNQTREKVLFGFALKHHISINDMRDDLDKGELPTRDKVIEKFDDAINYLILEKASFLDRIQQETYDINNKKIAESNIGGPKSE